MKVMHEMDCPEYKAGRTTLCECVKKELKRLQSKITELEMDVEGLLKEVWTGKLPNKKETKNDDYNTLWGQDSSRTSTK